MRKKLFSEIPCLTGDRLVLRRITRADRDGLQELMENQNVYRWLPTFLFERQYADPDAVIDRLYDEGWKESILLGIFQGEEFCGIAELYGWRDPIHKISVGYRLRERCWGKGIASESLRMLVEYLYRETDIEIITASTMIENRASANVLRKNGFQLVVHAVGEDWGYAEPTVTDKWIR